MHANRSTLVKLCLLTALAVPVQRAASATTRPQEASKFEAESTQLFAQAELAQSELAQAKQSVSYVYKGEPSPTVQGFLAVATSLEGEAAIAQVQETEGAAAAQLEGPAPTAESPSNGLIARTDENNVAIIEEASGNLVAGPLAGAGGAVTALAFSEDGQTLATGTNTGKVRYWGIDGEPKAEAFPAVLGEDNAVTELRFEGNDKLFVAGSQGRQGLWGLNGRSFGEAAPAVAVGDVAADDIETAADEGEFPWWLLLLPILGLAGAGLWLLSRNREPKTPDEPKRQTAPTATVPPPVTDPESDREVSTRAHSVISTDRVVDESRMAGAPEPVVAAAGLEATGPESRSADSTSLDSTSLDSTDLESTDLESPDLEGTNLDLLTPGAAVGGAAVLGLGGAAIAAGGQSSSLEDDEDDEWDDSLDLTLDEPEAAPDPVVPPVQTSSEPEVASTPPSVLPPAIPLSPIADSANDEDFWNTVPGGTDLGVGGELVESESMEGEPIADDSVTAELVANELATAEIAVDELSLEAPVPEEVVLLEDLMAVPTLEAPTVGEPIAAAEDFAFGEASETVELSETTEAIEAIEPTRDTVIAATDTVLDIEPDKNTIISDGTVIFGGAIASTDADIDSFFGSTETTSTEMPSPEDTSFEDTSFEDTSFEDTSFEDTGLENTTNLDADPAVSLTSAAAGLASGGAAAVAFTLADDPADDPADNPVDDPVKPETSRLSLKELASVDEGLAELPDGYGDSRIVLLPRDPKWAYAYWDVSNEHKEELRQQGGSRLMLRLYDVTDIDQNHQAPHGMQQQECHEMARSWYIEIPVSDRDYSIEIGYLTDDDRWLLLSRSASVRVPPVYPSDWVKDQFVTLGWGTGLADQRFGNLGRRGTLTEADAAQTAGESPVYDALFAFNQAQNELRLAGSLYGSMQTLPPGGLSASGMVPGLSMSGLNVSGLNVSGVGLGDRKRNFWLVADAELIVYGATEPDATLTIGDRVIPLSPDGTFRFHMPFPDGKIDYPIRAVAADGQQSRAITMNFERDTPERNTNTKADAEDEWF